MIITYHNVEVKRCLAHFDTIAIPENNMHKEKEKREKHESGRTKKKTDGAFVNPPFYCDYGKNIEVGKNFFANYNCMIIDVAKVIIGENCMMAPNVAIYTAGHPIHPAARNSAYEYGIEVTIGDNVWLGGNTVVVLGYISEVMWLSEQEAS